MAASVLWVLAIPATLRAPVPDRLDVIAVRVAHERTEVTGVIFGPLPRLMQRLGAPFHRRPVEGAHRVFVGGLAGQVHLPGGSHARPIRDPERCLAVTAVPDGPAEIHLPREPEHSQHAVVKILRFREIGAIDSEVVDHGKDPGTTTDAAVDYLDDLRPHHPQWHHRRRTGG